jgi:hypothetical protein
MKATMLDDAFMKKLAEKEAAQGTGFARTATGTTSAGMARTATEAALMQREETLKRIMEGPSETERRAFWREAFHSVDWDRTREADEVTKMCAKFADAALKEFDERFGK